MGPGVLSLLGGLGMFLFGMQAMTDGLRRLGSRRLRAILARFTRTPLSGAIVGATSTAILQSSSATILTVIGFVGAGLMTFPQALGVVMGANVGTTVTGWIVAVLGIKMQLGAVALPLLFVASLMMLIDRERIGRIGGALGGFAVVFIGLDMMQSAAHEIEPLLTAVIASADSLPGRLALVMAGAGFTILVQSSSAGVAVVLVLFTGGAIDLLQAGALVIGMDVGTSLKTLVVTAGKPVDARRTAYAHVSFNLTTAVLAFACIDFLPLIAQLTGDGPIAITTFHTLFNVAGVVAVLPFAGAFSRLVLRLVPGQMGMLPEPPDAELLDEPEAALDTARSGTDRIARAIADDMARRLSGQSGALDPSAALRSVEEFETFVTRIAVPSGRDAPMVRLAALMHRIDHLHRLLNRLGQEERIALLHERAAFAAVWRPVVLAARCIASRPASASVAARLPCLLRQVERRAGRLRQELLLSGSRHGDEFADAFAMTDALRWAERAAAHIERLAHYGVVAASESPTRAEARLDPFED